MNEKRWVIRIEETGIEDGVYTRSWEKGAGATAADPEAWGYTPEVVAKKPYKREIYAQIVSDLDIQAVIAAINKMER